MNTTKKASPKKTKPKSEPTERRIISFDYAMKSVLRDKANSGILAGFLSELIGRKVKVLAILESEGNVESREDKVNRVDIKAQIDKGEIAIFEIQYGDQYDFVGKALFNVSKAVVEQIKSGGFYDIRKVYMICIAEFDLGAKREYLFNAKMNGFKGVHFKETIPFAQTRDNKAPTKSLKFDIHPEYYLILPKKFDDEIRSRFDEWVYTIKNHAIKSDFKAAGIKEAAEKMDYLKMSEKERKNHDWNLRMRTDLNTTYETYFVKGLDKGEAIGIEKGKAIGREEGKAEGEAIGLEKGEAKKVLEIARVMKNDGMDINTIAKIVGLTVNEVEKL